MHGLRNIVCLSSSCLCPLWCMDRPQRAWDGANKHQAGSSQSVIENTNLQALGGHSNIYEIKFNLGQALGTPEKYKQKRSQTWKKLRSTITGQTSTWCSYPWHPTMPLSRITWPLHSQIHMSYEYLLYRYGGWN